MALTNRVRKARLRRGMKQAVLAERAKLGQATISDIESGKIVPGVDAALRLAAALGLTVEELFTWTEEK